MLKRGRERRGILSISIMISAVKRSSPVVKIRKRIGGVVHVRYIR